MAVINATERTRGDLLIKGGLVLSGSRFEMPTDAVLVGPTGFLTRSVIATDALFEYPIPFTAMRRYDDFSASLPATASPPGTAVGHFGLTGPSWSAGAASPVLTGTVSTLGSTETNYAAFFFPLPAEYVAGGAVEVRAVGSVNQSATSSSEDRLVVDANVFRWDGDGAVGSDLVTTGELPLNTRIERHRLAVDPTGLVPGDVLAVRLSTTLTDNNQTESRNATLTRVAVAVDVKG